MKGANTTMSSRGKKKRRDLAEANAAMELPKTMLEIENAVAAEACISAEIKALDRIAKREESAMRSGLAGLQADRQVEFHRKADMRRTVIGALERNGITLHDLEDEFERGREAGFQAAAMPIIKCCYAGIILALHDVFGFGQERCYRAIKAVDEKTLFSLHHSELADEVMEKTGIKLELDEPFERVQKIERSQHHEG